MIEMYQNGDLGEMIEKASLNKEKSFMAIERKVILCIAVQQNDINNEHEIHF